MAGVGFGEWLGELRAFDEAKAAEMAEHYPALKLLDFFEGREAEGRKGGGAFAMGRGMQRSAAMAALGPVDASLTRKWLGEWDF